MSGESPTTAARDPAGARILVVDDQQQNRDILQRRLERCGYTVILRDDARTLEADVLDEDIHLVLLDWMMPHRSGIEALAGLRSRFDLERMPVIMVTALESGGEVAQALQAGANDYVAKPIDFQVLLARLQVQLDRRRAVRALDQLRDHLEDEVTDRTRALTSAYADLAQALEQAKVADRLKSEFLTSMSHEIRTPLNSVLGSFELLRVDALTDAQDQLVQSGLSSGRMLLTLLNDLLDLSNVVSGAVKICAEPFDLRQCLEGVGCAHAGECGRKGLSLALDIGDGLDSVVGDEQRVRQCLFNLVGNAIKFTDAGGVRVAARRAGDQVEVDVVDTGVGMDEAALSVVFKPFMQADGSSTRRYGGAGVGLTLTQRLAELMDGGVRIQSRPGEGTRVTLTVRAPTAPAAAPVDDTHLPLAGLRILLVDDSPANIAIATHLLERLGAVVASAGGGREALAASASQAFDLILMDVQMPEMDGREATRRIRRGGGPNAGAPIVALTANVLPEQQETYRAAGMDGVVAKPVRPAELLRELIRVDAETGSGDGEEAASA